MTTRYSIDRSALLSVLLTLLLGACSDADMKTPGETAAPVQSAPVTATVEKGMYFKPDLTDYQLHNEYDADGNGDGVNETHVQRYINSKGDKAFSMTTGERLWAWSLDIQGDSTDIHKNFVIRDSNCDGVFDERYSLDAEYHVPDCLALEATGVTPEET